MAATLRTLSDKARPAIDPRTGDFSEYSDVAKAVWLDRQADKVYVVVGTDIQEFRTVPEDGVASRTLTCGVRSLGADNSATHRPTKCSERLTA